MLILQHGSRDIFLSWSLFILNNFQTSRSICLKWMIPSERNSGLQLYLLGQIAWFQTRVLPCIYFHRSNMPLEIQWVPFIILEMRGLHYQWNVHFNFTIMYYVKHEKQILKLWNWVPDYHATKCHILCISPFCERFIACLRDFHPLRTRSVKLSYSMTMGLKTLNQCWRRRRKPVWLFSSMTLN